MRHALSILAVVALVGVASLMLSVNLMPGPNPLAVQYFGNAIQQQSKGNTVVVQVDIGELLGNEVQALTENQLSLLSSGTINARDSRSDYFQSIEFYDPGLFSGGKVVFAKSDNSREVTDFLQFDDAVFKYRLEFSPGLTSDVEDGELTGIDNENFNILGSRFTLVDSDVDLNGGRIELKFFGGFGTLEFTDNDFKDGEFNRGVRVNGRNIDALVRIRAVKNGNKLTIASINYILNANAASGDLQVLPRRCVREFLQYPLGMLTPNFGICYKGLEGGDLPEGPVGVPSNQIFVRSSGDDEYVMTATNVFGQVYKIPLAQLPGEYGNKGRNLVFKEAANGAAPNIDLGDYFVLMSRDSISGVSHVLRYDSRAGSTVYFEDLAGGSKSASFNPDTGEGILTMGEGSYKFVVGPNDELAMDQNNDKKIDGGEAQFVILGGPRIDFGPGFTIRLIVPKRLFNEPMGDEVTKFNILFGKRIDLDVPSPQGIMELQSKRGRKQGLTRYGVFFDWDTDSGSDDLTIGIPGARSSRVKRSAVGEVFISLERDKLMKPVVQQAAPIPKCGDGVITKPEYCDPPGSLCAKPGLAKGKCASNCLQCLPITPVAKCGNGKLEKGEACEANADCAAGKICNGCACQNPPAVCGNNLIEAPETCEKNADCAVGDSCNGCQCVSPAPKKAINCQFGDKCRVWDNSCGGNGKEKLMVDGVPSGCVDAYAAASQGIDYCGKFTLGRGNTDCNYQSSSTKSNCVCPRGPQLQSPSQVAIPTGWQKFWWAVSDFFRPGPIPKPKGAVGEVCNHGGECQTGNCIYAGGEGAMRTYKCSCDPFKLTSFGC